MSAFHCFISGIIGTPRRGLTLIPMQAPATASG
jgi:hypothetical protein